MGDGDGDGKILSEAYAHISTPLEIYLAKMLSKIFADS